VISWPSSKATANKGHINHTLDLHTDLTSPPMPHTCSFIRTISEHTHDASTHTRTHTGPWLCVTTYDHACSAAMVFHPTSTSHSTPPHPTRPDLLDQWMSEWDVVAQSIVAGATAQPPFVNPTPTSQAYPPVSRSLVGGIPSQCTKPPWPCPHCSVVCLWSMCLCVACVSCEGMYCMRCIHSAVIHVSRLEGNRDRLYWVRERGRLVSLRSWLLTRWPTATTTTTTANNTPRLVISTFQRARVV
jgi:hypothetical protein